MPLFEQPPFDAALASNQPFTGTFRITGGPRITVGSDASGASVSVARDVGSFWENGVPDVKPMALGTSSLNSNLVGGRLILQPLGPDTELFPYDISVTQAMLNFSYLQTTSAIGGSGAFTSSYMLGFYTRVNSTQLTLVNSALRTLAAFANVSNFNAFLGARYVSFHSSQFSSNPVFSQGGRYWFAQLIRSSSNFYSAVGGSSPVQFGLAQGASIQRSGQLGAAPSSATSSNAWYPFMGVHSLTTHTALPGSIAHSQIDKRSDYANFIPHLIFNGGLAPVG